MKGSTVIERDIVTVSFFSYKIKDTLLRIIFDRQVDTLVSLHHLANTSEFPGKTHKNPDDFFHWKFETKM